MVLERLQSWMRRLLLGSGIAITIFLVMFVRPEGHEPKDGETVVKLWRVTGAEDVEPQVPAWFSEKQSDIYVQSVGLPFLEIEQKFMTASVGNITPDLFEYFGPVAQWSTRGALMPLDDLMKRDGFDRSAIYPELWNEMMFNGKTYAVPVGTANEAFYWNKAHFRAAGLDPERPPQTWEELEEYAIKLTTYNQDGSIKQAGYIPGYWSPFPTYLFLNWPVQLGAKFLEDEGHRVNLTANANVEALRWEGELFKKLGGKKLIEKRASFGYGAQHGFHSSQLSMIVQKSSFVQEMQQFSPEIEYGVSMLPVPKGGHPAVVAGSVWIGIPAGAKNPEAAWEYIKFYASNEVQLRAAEFVAEKNIAAFFPANVQAAESPFQMNQPHMDVFTTSMDYAHPSTVVPLAHTMFWRSYGDAWDRVMRGDATPIDALRKAEGEVQATLDSQIKYNDFYMDYLKRHEK